MKTVADLLIAYNKAHPKKIEKPSPEEADKPEKAGIEAE